MKKPIFSLSAFFVFFLVNNAFSQTKFNEKALDLIVGSGAGGALDVHARILAREGLSPLGVRVVIKNMPGGGSTTAIKYLYELAPKDGSTIGGILSPIGLLDRSHTGITREMLRQFNWLGTLSKNPVGCWVSKSSDIKKFDDIFKKNIIGTYRANFSGIYEALNQAFPTSITPMPRPPSREYIEVLRKSRYGESFTCGYGIEQTINVTLLVTSSRMNLRDFSQAPLIWDLVKRPDDLRKLTKYFGAEVVYNPFTLPPKVSPNTVAELRKIFFAAADAVHSKPKFRQFFSIPEAQSWEKIIAYLNETRLDGYTSHIAQEKKRRPKSPSRETDDTNKIIAAASGSGFAVSQNGHVITNYHVIKGCQNVKVHHSGQTFSAKVVSSDPQNDLALIQANFKPAGVLSISSNSPELLQEVYVAGFPFGRQVSESVKVTKGIISSLTGIGNNFSNIQIDAALQPGNSGGPILDNHGNVVGVAVARLDKIYSLKKFGSFSENVNFGIKASLVRSILEANGVEFSSSGTASITTKTLGTKITKSTFYLSCWMTVAQIKAMKNEKVMFKNSD